MLYAMESAWNSPARTRGTKRMATQPALTQAEDGSYAELETEGDQALEGGGAQTVQGRGGPEQSRSDDDGTRGVRGRIRHR